MTTPEACTGRRYHVNPTAPDEGTDVHHDGSCPVHPTPEDHAALNRRLAEAGAMPEDDTYLSTTRAVCEVCRDAIAQVVEPHATYWISVHDLDSLSYVPDLHDHAPRPADLGR